MQPGTERSGRPAGRPYGARDLDAVHALRNISREVDPEFKQGGEVMWKVNIDRDTREWCASNQA